MIILFVVLLDLVALVLVVLMLLKYMKAKYDDVYKRILEIWNVLNDLVSNNPKPKISDPKVINAIKLAHESMKGK